MLETLIKVWFHENQTLIFFFVLKKKGVCLLLSKEIFLKMIDALVLRLLLLLSLHAIDEQKEERTDPCHAVIAQYDHAIALSPHVVWQAYTKAALSSYIGNSVFVMWGY